MADERESGGCPHINMNLSAEIQNSSSIPLVDIKANYLSVQSDIDASLAKVRLSPNYFINILSGSFYWLVHWWACSERV